MGKYKIQIDGIGSHHNGDPVNDADLLAKNLVDTLRLKGHTINIAEFHELDFEGKPARKQDAILTTVEYIIPPEKL